ncbi:MAG TPA: ammonium transporter, partial [Verrucomicrobiae bacterium]|nr:ammonium transporter [Verrucomicrobiae bacterium]
MKASRLVFILTLLMLLAVPGAAFAADAATIDTGDTTFITIATSLVMLMTPGLALFYGGMVRRKNVLSTFMQSFVLIAVVSIQWVLIGYTLAFGPDKGHLIGSLAWLGFNGVGMTPNADYAGTIPHQIFAMFQLMFAIITPALITGSIAERMRFPAFLAFGLLWATFIYDPLAHWVWGVDGWIRNLGALDFAGGTVVHISSGVSGLIAALVLGRRKGYGKEPLLPHHVPMTVLGAGLLWFGWFGFNAGSALAANGLATNAFVVTNTSAAAAALSWMFAEWLHHGKPTVLGVASGAVAGLVAITPASGFVTPLAAIIIGLVGGVVCYLGVSVLKSKLGYDDSLDAFGCHGIGGTWGAIATGLFATTSVNSAGADGLFYGGGISLVVKQFIAIGASYGIAIFATFILLKVIGLVLPLRVSAEDEEAGMDIALHG